MWKLNKTDKNIIRQIILFVCFCVMIVNPASAIPWYDIETGFTSIDCPSTWKTARAVDDSTSHGWWGCSPGGVGHLVTATALPFQIELKIDGYYPYYKMATVENSHIWFNESEGNIPIGASATWDKSEYEKGETATIIISYNSSNFDTTLNNYEYDIVDPDNEYVRYQELQYSASQTISIVLSKPGVYQGSIYISNKSGGLDDGFYLSSYDNIIVSDGTIESFITFNRPSYTLGQEGIISWGISSSFWDNFGYNYIEIYRDGSLINEITDITNFGTVNYDFPSIGTYYLKLYQWNIYGTNLRSTSLISYVEFNPSYLYVNSSIPIKTEVNVSYFLGETNSNTEKENVIQAAYLDNGQYIIEDSCYFSSESQTGSCPMNVDHVGTYLFTLKNLPLNFILDSKVVETYYVDLKPKYNFTTSGINVTKSPVYQGESIQGNYFVKGSLFNSSQIYIDAFNINQSFKYNTQLELLTDSGTFNMVMPEIRTGWNILFLNYTNSTGSGSLANVSFNVIGVNPSGYGLTLSSYNIIVGEDYSVNIILPPYPAKGKLIVVEQTYNEEIFNMSLNSSMSIPQKINIMGTYSYILTDNNNEIQVMRLLTVNPYPTPNGTAIPDNDGESGTQSGRQMDGLVLLLGQGLTTESKLIFSVLMMTIIIVAIYWSTRSQFIAVIAGGFWFIWMTIIEYIPLWVIIVIVIAMLIKGKFGGE